MTAPERIDFKKAYRPLFSAPVTDFVEVVVPDLPFLMIDGQGSPGTSQEYRDALGCLYPAAYALKFFSKQALGRDYVVPPLEGLWWSEALDAFTQGRRDEWSWTMMIMLPGWITADHFSEALARLMHKKPQLDFSRLRMAQLSEGRCLQKLHKGSFADEAPVLHRLHAELMPSQGLTFNGPHHEIYLGDPRKVAPERMRTILRQPVKAV